MINFIICSSNYNRQNKTKEVIDSYMMNYDIEVKYHLYNNYSEDTKKSIKSVNGYKSYILEIDEDNIVNMFVKYLREDLDDWNSLIILTTDKEIKIEKYYTYRLFLFDLINYNISFEKILVEDINRIMKNYDHREKCLTFESNRVVKRIDFKNIIMIMKEKDSKKCLLKSSHGNYYVPESLCGISKRLDKRFVKTNRSCIVNGDHIIEYKPNENKLVFKNGFVFLDISREQKKEVSNYVTNYK